MTPPVPAIIAVLSHLNFRTLARCDISPWAVQAALYHCQWLSHSSWKFFVFFLQCGVGAHSQALPCIMKRPRERVSVLRKPSEDPNQKAPAPIYPNLFSHPHLRPTLAKKSASTCRIRKDGLQKYPQMQESSRNRAPLPPPFLLLLFLLLLLLSFLSHFPSFFFFWQHGSLNEKKCKCCRPRQRLRHLFQRVTPLSEFRFHLLLLNPHV